MSLHSLEPSGAASWHQLGVAACQQGRLNEGVELFRKAVAVWPDFVLGWMDLGAALRELSDPVGAVACFDRALAIDPRHLEAHNSRGEALSAQHLHEEALRSYEAVARLNAQDARGHSNAGAALLELGRLEAALERFDRALLLQPRYVRAILNRGAALHRLGRFAESIAHFDLALRIQPDCAEAQSNRGLVRLLLGQFADGWRDNEARLRTVGAYGTRDFVQPSWRGDSDLRGQAILLHAEQGLGDTIQFCRYVPLVAALGARVVLEAQPELVPMLRTLAGGAHIVACGDPLPAFDVHCPLLSLPLAFGTDLSAIPSPSPYLQPDAERAGHWQGRLGPSTRPIRIGLAWSGSRALKNDRNRSLPLQHLLNALAGADAELISLQKELGQNDRDKLSLCDTVRHFGEELTDFGDTAALVSLLDLVVTVDTSVAHLAAAIGAPTWILLPAVPDWRWLLDRSGSPWYRTVRLWRQQVAGDWSSALVPLRAALDDLVGRASGRR